MNAGESPIIRHLFGKSLKKQGAIGTDKLENILNIYPDISPLWLLKGEGNMISANETGIEMVETLKAKGYGIIATGEMGIGNTTTSSALAAVFLGIPVEVQK